MPFISGPTPPSVASTITDSSVGAGVFVTPTVSGLFSAIMAVNASMSIEIFVVSNSSWESVAATPDWLDIRALELTIGIANQIRFENAAVGARFMKVVRFG